jgi:hypothetical protein
MGVCGAMGMRRRLCGVRSFCLLTLIDSPRVLNWVFTRRWTLFFMMGVRRGIHDNAILQARFFFLCILQVHSKRNILFSL